MLQFARCKQLLLGKLVVVLRVLLRKQFDNLVYNLVGCEVGDPDVVVAKPGKRDAACESQVVPVALGLAHTLTGCRTSLLGESSLCPLFYFLVLLRSSVELSDPNKVERIGSQTSFYFKVERGVRDERRVQVDFQDPRLKLGVNQDVEAEHFETVVSVELMLPHG